MNLLSDRKYALAILILSMVYTLSAYNLDADFDPTHEKFYSFVLGISMVGMSLALFIWPTKQKVSWPDMKRFKNIGITILAILVYSLVLHRLGFLICATVLMGLCMWVFNAKLKYIIPASIIVAVSFYILFDRLLGLTLPAGILNFF